MHPSDSEQILCILPKPILSILEGLNSSWRITHLPHRFRLVDQPFHLIGKALGQQICHDLRQFPLLRIAVGLVPRFDHQGMPPILSKFNRFQLEDGFIKHAQLAVSV
ncbi:MAG: hypothetical protein ACJZ7A_07395 [Opitutales bacterium]